MAKSGGMGKSDMLSGLKDRSAKWPDSSCTPPEREREQ